MFEFCRFAEEKIADKINGYLVDGFRPDRTKGLQALVVKYLRENKERILNNAIYWWQAKMIYIIYKYEVTANAKIRNVMKVTISVEHVLSQEWQWAWIKDVCETPGLLTDEEKTKWLNDVGKFINGIGNLLLVTPGVNAFEGNKRPAEKIYGRYSDGGSYKEHDLNREQWRSSKQWAQLVRDRREKIFDFMLSMVVDSRPLQATSSPVSTTLECLA